MKDILDNSPNDIFYIINEIEEKFKDVETLSDYYDLTMARNLKNLLIVELAHIRNIIDERDE